MATQASKLIINRARKLYEEDGETFAAISRSLGFTAATVKKWSQKGGWVSANAARVSDAIAEDDALTEEIPPSLISVESVREGSEQELRDKLETLETRNRELEVENEKLSPTVDISAMLEDRVQWITDNSPEGERFWLNRAEAKFKNDNIQRAKEGLPGFNINDHPDILDDLINELKTKEATRRVGEPDEPPSRKVKLYIKRKGQMPVIEQLPMENQVNNMAGSLADGIIRYTRKGFKLTKPFLCPRAGCYAPAAVDEFQRWRWDGYCTEKHRIEVEGKEEAPTTGIQVQLKDTILSGVN